LEGRHNLLSKTVPYLFPIMKRQREENPKDGNSCTGCLTGREREKSVGNPLISVLTGKGGENHASKLVDNGNGKKRKEEKEERKAEREALI